VILSAAHLSGGPAGRDVLAVCEACHIALDRAQHWATRRRNEEARLGLIPLFDLDPV
jgi:hypothetical protein